MMGTTKLVVGCFAGAFSSVIGFGITYDWMKKKKKKPASGSKDIPEKEIQYESGKQEQEA